MKTGFVAITGRPSSGKSTFLNVVCGCKVSIVSPYPQTTRNKIRGIFNDGGGKGQLVFIDTPGYHSSGKKLNSYMKSLVFSTIGECDLILYIADVSRPFGDEEEAILHLIAEAGKPAAAGLNKIDVKRNFINDFTGKLDQLLPNAPRFPISAKQDQGIDSLLAKLLELSPEGEPFYPEEFYTDQPPEFRIAEIIREKAIAESKEELPHCIFVEILDMEMREEENLLWVRGFIYVERESQKGILVGKGGEKIKRIMGNARTEIAALFPYEVSLDFRVKVQYKWRRNDLIIKKLIE